MDVWSNSHDRRDRGSLRTVYDFLFKNQRGLAVSSAVSRDRIEGDGKKASFDVQCTLCNKGKRR